MKKNSDLFELIESLTPPEKRHFKLTYGKKDGADANQYIKLFDTLDLQDQEDEMLAMKRLGLSSRAKFSRVKSYLYKNILESLEDYYRDNSVDAEFFHSINQAQILGRRGLLKQQGKMLKRSMKLADVKGIGLYQMLIERLEISRLVEMEDFSSLEKFLEDYEDRKKYQLEKSGDYLDFQMLKAKIIWLLRRGHSNAERKAQWLEELDQHEMLNTIKYPEDTEYILYCYNLNGLVSAQLGREDDDYKYRKAYLDTYQSNPDFIRRWPHNYVTALGNVASLAAARKETEELFACTVEMRTFFRRFGIRNQANLMAVAEVRSYALESGVLSLLDEETASELYDNLRTCYKDKRKRVTKLWRRLLLHGMAHYHFLRAEWKEALEYFQKVIRNDDDDFYLELQHAARLGLLISYFELGEDRYLESYVTQFKSWLRNKKRDHEGSQQIARFIATSLHRNSEERTKRVEKYIPGIQESQEADSNTVLGKLINLDRWLKKYSSVLEGK